MLTRDDVRQVFTYDERTGMLLKRACPTCGCYNAPVYNTHGEGYLTVAFQGKTQLMHRLVWVYFNGPIKDGMVIDHIDGNRANNRIENLRMVTRQRNNMNKCLRKDNTSGYTGVQYDKTVNKWNARIKLNGALYNLGNFLKKEDAINMRKQAEITYGYTEARRA
jgi:hypothetical protein